MRNILLFDLEGTLTEEGQEITKEMVDILGNLNTYFHVISKNELDPLVDQFFSPMYRHGFRGDFLAFPNAGEAVYKCLYTDLMHIRLEDADNIEDDNEAGVVELLSGKHKVVVIGKVPYNDGDYEFHQVDSCKDTISLLKEKGYV